ncbi:MAG: ribonuclease domain-containing protein [Pseudomonadota bacterium]
MHLRKWGLHTGSAVLLAVLAGVAAVNPHATANVPNRLTAQGAAPATGTVSLAALPAEAQQTERLIRAGGPFPYPKDGLVFGNRERLLPLQARGYYREYTVRTPGSRDRGARRIVCGGRQPREPDACFYTEDHYASFKRITP